MNGFETIKTIYRYSYQEIADCLGITKQSVYDWTKEQYNIPPIRVKQLSDLFIIPDKYITLKEVREIDKLEVMKFHMKKIEKDILNFEETLHYKTKKRINNNKNQIQVSEI